jgi:hypothetical protein
MKRLLVLAVLLGVVLAVNAQAQCGPPLPTPRVAFLNKVNEPGFVRYWFTVTNRATYIYGYCALPNNAAMAKLSFAVPSSNPQPKSFYITLEDRLCHVTKTSNKAAIP